MLRPFAQEEITIDATVGGVGLTAATYAMTGWGNAQKAVIQVLDASIRIKTDGGAPTSSTGFAESPGNSFELETEAEIVNFKAIRASGSDAKIIVTYYRKS